MAAPARRHKPKVKRQSISASVLVEVADLADEAAEVKGETRSVFIGKAVEERAKRVLKLAKAA